MRGRSLGPACNRALLALAIGLCVPSAALALDAAPIAASADATALAARIVATQDTHGHPFLIVDKVAASVFVYGPDGTLRAASPALLGAARGDVPPVGIGSRTLAQIGPADRITQAGRFEARIGRDLHEDVLWIDYDSGLSLHRVATGNRAEHRLTRLATATTEDNRISFGCINVPRIFYETVVAPLFAPTYGIVYILPEQRSIAATFPTLSAAPPAHG